MGKNELLFTMLAEGFTRPAWHGPNLRQSLKGVRAKQAAWRPAHGRHNIWELALHCAYWKHVVRRKIEGRRCGSFVLKGRNFFTRPVKGKATEAAWRSDLALLEKEHRALQQSVRRVLKTTPPRRLLRMLYGIAFHDVYHAGQIRLLRRLMER